VRQACRSNGEAEIDPPGPLPDDVRKVLDYMRLRLEDPIALADLVGYIGVPERTLNEHFRAFVGVSPMQHLRRMRLGKARKLLIAAGPTLTVTEVAQRLRFYHAGRFSQQYRQAFGETPSETLKRVRSTAAAPPVRAASAGDVSILIAAASDSGAGTVCHASRFCDVLGAALSALSWLSISLLHSSERPGALAYERAARTARFVLNVRCLPEHGRLRLSFDIRERATGSVIWCDSIEGPGDRVTVLEDRLVHLVGSCLGSALRRAEIARAIRSAPADLDARGLAMRALPALLASSAEGSSRALELLDRAMEFDPDNALAASLAAWGYGQQVMYNATSKPGEDRERALRLVRRAAVFGADDPTELTARCAVHMMLGDLASAETMIARALSLDPGSGWAWGRSGWLHAYRGDWTMALAHFRKALQLGPHQCRPNILAGMGGAHFGAGRYEAVVRSCERALREQPAMEWCNRSLSVAYARLGERRKARQSVESLRRYRPGLTVRDVVAAVPYQPDFLDRLANGLDGLGLPP